MRRPVLALRADGGPGIGSGHTARCLALGERWSRHGRAVLVSDAVPDTWLVRAAAMGVEVVATADAPTHVDWWLSDGYDLSDADRRHGMARIGLIDDEDASQTGGLGADLVLDQSSSEASRYADAGGVVLVGPRYALLRRELRDAASRVRSRSRSGPREPTTVALLAGGAPTGDVLRIFEASGRRLAGDGFAVELLAGGNDLTPVLERATVVVAAAGSTCWEVAHCGVPLVAVPVAANQRPVVESLRDAGAATIVEHLEVEPLVAAVRALAADPGRAEAVAEAGRRLIDGHGTDRVVAALRAGLIALRPVSTSDRDRILAWSNDPSVRAASFTTESIDPVGHDRWFAARLADADHLMWIAAGPGGQDLGLVRFAVEGSAAVASVAMPSSRQGQGWGAGLVWAGCDALARARPEVDEAVALVKSANPRSAAAFIAADFDRDRADGLDGTPGAAPVGMAAGLAVNDSTRRSPPTPTPQGSTDPRVRRYVRRMGVRR